MNISDDGKKIDPVAGVGPKLPGARMVITRIAIIIFVVELCIMGFFAALPFELATLPEAIVDSLLLLLSTPMIYLWVIKPFVVARDEAHMQISHMAYHDPLTHLPNRRLLNEFLERSIAFNGRHHTFGALLLIDLDDFREINDKRGHDVGDTLLIGFAERLLVIARSEDMVCRLGGDEFVVLLQQLGDDEKIARDKALVVAEKIHTSLKQSFDREGLGLSISASIGICILDADVASARTALKEADAAMYRAREAKGVRIVAA